MAAPPKLVYLRRIFNKVIFSQCNRFIFTNVCGMKNIKVGDLLPDITVYEHTPDNIIRIRDVFKDKKGIIFSVPGAFNPSCSQGHIPEYLEMYDKFLVEGYSILSCVCVNDPFVLAAWAKEIDPDQKMRMFADIKGEFTKAIDMELESSRIFLGTVRSKRYTLLVDNNYVTHINGPDDTGLSCLLCIQRQKATIPGHKTP